MVINFKKHKIPIILFLVTFLVYFLSKEKNFTAWNHYVRLANSFLHGKLYFLDYQPYLEAAFFKGRHFPVSPPMPAILLIPAVLIFGKNFPQPLFSFLFGSLNGVLSYLLLKRLKIKKGIALISSILLVFGTNHWYLVLVGSYWYVAHIIAFTFMLLALLEFFGKRRLFWVGFLTGCAYWTRLPTIFASIFFFLFIVTNKSSLDKKIKDLLKLFLPLAGFLCLNSLYNFLRFKNLWDKGYLLIPNLWKEPWYQEGIFSLNYIPKNLKLIFWTFPSFIKKFPFFLPPSFGMAIWITTPAFLILPISLFIKEKIIPFSLLTIFFLALPSLLHGEGGGFQFGYRYSMDYAPFLLILTAKSFEKIPKWLIYFLVFGSILVNFWGVLLFNKLN